MKKTLYSLSLVFLFSSFAHAEYDALLLGESQGNVRSEDTGCYGDHPPQLSPNGQWAVACLKPVNANIDTPFPYVLALGQARDVRDIRRIEPILEPGIRTYYAFNAINSSGRAIGTSYSTQPGSGGDETPFFMDGSHPNPTLMPLPYPVTPGRHQYVVPRAITDQNVIVGDANGRAIIWSEAHLGRGDYTWALLPHFNTGLSDAVSIAHSAIRAVDGSLVVVGEIDVAAPGLNDRNRIRHAFLWTSATRTMMDLHPFGFYTNSRAVKISPVTEKVVIEATPYSDITGFGAGTLRPFALIMNPTPQVIDGRIRNIYLPRSSSSSLSMTAVCNGSDSNARALRFPLGTSCVNTWFVAANSQNEYIFNYSLEPTGGSSFDSLFYMPSRRTSLVRNNGIIDRVLPRDLEFRDALSLSDPGDVLIWTYTFGRNYNFVSTYLLRPQPEPDFDASFLEFYGAGFP